MFRFSPSAYFFAVATPIFFQQQQQKSTSTTFKPGTNPGNVSAPTNVNYHPTEIQSAYQLLRLLLRSAEVKVRSRQGKQFMKRRIISQWRIGRAEQDPLKQRAWMERAAAVLHAMHIKGRNPRPDEPIELDFSTGPGALRKSRAALEDDMVSAEVDATATRVKSNPTSAVDTSAQDQAMAKTADLLKQKL